MVVFWCWRGMLTVENVGGGRLLPDVSVGLGGEGEVRHDGGYYCWMLPRVRLGSCVGWDSYVCRVTVVMKLVIWGG